MATNRVVYRYPSAARVITIIAAAIVLLASFGVNPIPGINLFEFGVALFIASFVI